MGDAAEVFEQIAVVAEVWAEHLGDAEHEMPVRHRILSASSALKSWTFFWWQDGQNQRPLREKANRRSSLQ